MEQISQKETAAPWPFFQHTLSSEQSAAHNLGAFNATGRIPGVDDQLSFADDVVIVVVRVVGDDQDAVVLAEILQFRALHLQVVLAAFANEWKVGIVIADLGSVFLQQFDNGERRRLAQIVDIFFVRHTQHQHAGAIHRLLVAVQRAGHGRQNVVGHVVVNLSGQLDEAGLEIKLFRFPREIERVDGNAVPAQARAGIKGMEAERLGGGGFNDLPDIDAHAQTQQLEFVDQRDVDAAVNVLQQFGHFRGRRG